MSLRFKLLKAMPEPRNESGASSTRNDNSDLFLHMPVVFLQAAHYESSEVVLVHEAFHGRGEGGDGRGDRNARDHGLGAHLDLHAERATTCSSNEKMQAFTHFPRFATFIDHGFGAGLYAAHTIASFVK